MVIACVVPATEDSANITAWQLAQDHDPHGKRTIGAMCGGFSAAVRIPYQPL